MKYKAYLSSSLEKLENEELLCESEDIEEVLSILSKHPRFRGDYWRWMFFDFGAAIDYGSWSSFIIIPNAKMEDCF